MIRGSGQLPTSSRKTDSPFYSHTPLPSITFFNSGKAVSREAAKGTTKRHIRPQMNADYADLKTWENKDQALTSSA
jgi:hypothetical protein